MKMGICSVLGLIFVTLKLTGVIAWSWLWVLLPFWGPCCAGYNPGVHCRRRRLKTLSPASARKYHLN